MSHQYVVTTVGGRLGTALQHYDHIIVGHGLAGATLAIELKNRGQSVCIFDRSKGTSASRVAAGLMTPITGKRFALTPEWEMLWPAAVSFYRNFERQAGQRFLTETPAIRIFRDEDERSRFEDRRPRLSTLVEEPSSLDGVRSPVGGFQMREAGRLNVADLLDAHRALERPHWHSRAVRAEDIVTTPEGIRIADIRADRLTWCHGFRSEPNPWFPKIVFEAAKGEMLALRIPDLQEARTIHANGLWMASIAKDVYRVGATYEWEVLDSVPTDDAKSSLLERVKQFLELPFEVVDHMAAVRPIVYGRQPVAGVSAIDSRIGYVNGLGSKGSLLAPSLACMYADLLDGIGEIPPAYDVHRRFP